MQIIAESLGKKFVHEWVVRRFDYSFNSGLRYAIVGPNGSGKSTLLQLLMGFIPPTQGTVRYLNENGGDVSAANWHQYISFAAPYMDLVEEFTLGELLSFHTKFKPLINSVSSEELAQFARLANTKHKPIRHYSSGMKQRLKLSLAILSASSVVFLDEPTSNLDVDGMAWYQGLVRQWPNNRLLVLASNQPEEYKAFEHILSIADYR